MTHCFNNNTDTMVSIKPSLMALHYRQMQIVQHKGLQFSVRVINRMLPYVIFSNKYHDICHRRIIICNIRYQSTREGKKKKHLNWGLTSPNHLHKCRHYLFILLLQFSSLFFIRLFIICSSVVPHLTQFLCDVPNGQTRMFSFDFWTKLRAK